MTERTSKTLALLIDRQLAGSVTERDGRLELSYHLPWQADPTAIPLSLSMPLTSPVHGDRVTRAVLWGLLPDNEQVLERWGRTYQVSARNPFALLRHVGEDCAGAAQFAPDERVDALLAGEGNIVWIDDAGIAARLRALRKDPTAWHAAVGGQFSLAGAQAKTALHYDAETDRWGDPSGAVPTTHILKPAIAGFDDHDLNEHLCLEAARTMGIPAAASAIQSFGEERAIVVERYDRRQRSDHTVLRVHQEDMCQALGTPPTSKYESEGGPSAAQIIELLEREVRPAQARGQNVRQFVDALGFNWIIGGTDAHAKNYSVLISARQVRLAPLYDIASALPYEGMHHPKLKMAMRIGGEYRLEAISGRHWRRFSTANRLDPDAVVARVADLATRTPDALAQAVAAKPVRALGSDLPGRLLELVTARAARCLAALAR